MTDRERKREGDTETKEREGQGEGGVITDRLRKTIRPTFQLSNLVG